VPDGAVPITIINRHRSDNAGGPSADHGVVKAALRDERATWGRAERSLQEALATIRDLQTKLGHAELACREVSGTAEAARAEVDILRAEHQERKLRWIQDLAAERAACTAAEAAVTEAESTHGQAARTRRSPATVEPALKAQDTSPKPAAKVAAKRTRKAAEPRQREPQPVKWWLKSARKHWP